MAMFFTEPERIVFESDMDVVAYVSGGMCVPSKKNFEAVMSAVKESQRTIEAVPSETGAKGVVVNGDGIPDTELLEKYMREVYKNRRTDRLRTVSYVLLATSAAMLVGKAVCKRCAQKEFESVDFDGRHSLCVGDELVDGDIPEIY